MFLMRSTRDSQEFVHLVDGLFRMSPKEILNDYAPLCVTKNIRSQFAFGSISRDQIEVFANCAQRKEVVFIVAMVEA